MSAPIVLAQVLLSLDSQLGTSSSPYLPGAFPETSGYGSVLRFDAKVRLGSKLRIGGRAALALMRVEQPAGAFYAEAAWGNPELSAGLEQALWTRGKWTLVLAPQLAVGIPLAEHDSQVSQLEGRALALADAFEGLSQPELFTPGVLPLTPAAQLELADPRWRFTAALKLPVLLRVSNANLPSESEPRAFGLVPVLELGVRFQAWRWLALGLGPRLAWRALPPVSGQAAALQPLACVSTQFHFLDIDAALKLRAPVAGPLGGSTIAGGLELQASF